MKLICYVVVPELPIEEQEPFKRWLYGQTVPIVPEEGTNASKCAYKHDYLQWKHHYDSGRVASTFD